MNSLEIPPVIDVCPVCNGSRDMRSWQTSVNRELFYFIHMLEPFIKVADQGQTPLCWAFTAKKTIEAMIFMKTGEVVELSVQDMLNRICKLPPKFRDFEDFKKRATDGTFPFLTHLAYGHINRNGVRLEADVPYIGQHYLFSNHLTEAVRYRLGMPPVLVNDRYVTIDGVVPIACNDEIELLRRVRHHPVSVEVHLSAWDMHRFGELKSRRMFTVESTREMVESARTLTAEQRLVEKDHTIVSHALILIGAGICNKPPFCYPFWYVLNSWGASWGTRGIGAIPMASACPDKFIKYVNACCVVVGDVPYGPSCSSH